MLIFLLFAVVGTVIGLAALALAFATRTDGRYSWDRHYKWYWVAPAVVGCLTALVGWIGFGGTTADRIGCRNTAHNVHIDYRWSLSTGCMFRFQDRYIPKDRWIHITRGSF